MLDKWHDLNQRKFTVKNSEIKKRSFLYHLKLKTTEQNRIDSVKCMLSI